MACPTCSHTMQCVGETSPGIRSFWCPRCGTLKTRGGCIVEAIDTPKLVERCRRYERSLIECGTPSPAYLGKEWRTFGIAEAINLPEARPA